jgi:phosphoribosylformylglycinamidine cyclo-ligase
MSEELGVGSEQIAVGKLLLSPTRTFAPVMKELLENHFDAINGLIHCSGGGQTKCMKYVPENVRIVKDNLFEPPIIFDLIQKASKSSDEEMYQVFNMGTRMEIYTNEKDAENIISISKSFGVDAKVIGRVEESAKKELVITLPGKTLNY